MEIKQSEHANEMAGLKGAINELRQNNEDLERQLYQKDQEYRDIENEVDRYKQIMGKNNNDVDHYQKIIDDLTE